MAKVFRPSTRESSILSKIESSKEHARRIALQGIRDCQESLANAIAMKLVEDNLVETTSKNTLEEQISRCLEKLTQFSSSQHPLFLFDGSGRKRQPFNPSLSCRRDVGRLSQQASPRREVSTLLRRCHGRVTLFSPSFKIKFYMEKFELVMPLGAATWRCDGSLCC